MLMYLAVFAVIIGLWWFVLIDAARVPGRIWEETGRNKAMWLFLLIVIPVGGVVVYLALVRRDLHREWAAFKKSIRRAPAPPTVSTGMTTCPACGFTSNSAYVEVPTAGSDAAPITRCRNCNKVL